MNARSFPGIGASSYNGIIDSVTGWATGRWHDIRQIHYELLSGKNRSQARLPLAGQWEAAGYASQSEAEWNLVLLVSGITDDRALWYGVLLSSGLGERDRNCTRNEDGKGHKLNRPDYIKLLISGVAARRTELWQTGDPNLAPARHVFSTFAHQPEAHSPLPTLPDNEGDVIDAKKNPRGRPKGAPKRRTARIALVTFLASEQVISDHNGYIRVPVMEAAKAMSTSRETLRKAIHDLHEHGLAEGPEPKAYKKRDNFSKDRYLRLAVPVEIALSCVDDIP